MVQISGTKHHLSFIFCWCWVSHQITHTYVMWLIRRRSWPPRPVIGSGWHRFRYSFLYSFTQSLMNGGWLSELSVWIQRFYISPLPWSLHCMKRQRAEFIMWSYFWISCLWGVSVSYIISRTEFALFVSRYESWAVNFWAASHMFL